MVLHQLTPLQGWDAELFEALKAAGGQAYSNYAVGYNNVEVPAATERGIAVGNTPGTLVKGRTFLYSTLGAQRYSHDTRRLHFRGPAVRKIGWPWAAALMVVLPRSQQVQCALE